MGERHPFRTRRTKKAAGGTYDEVEFGPIVENRLYRITRFSAEDETTDPTGDLRCYIKGHGYNHWLVQEESPATATLYWESEPTFLVMGESLVARITGATANDVLNLYVEGEWEEPG